MESSLKRPELGRPHLVRQDNWGRCHQTRLLLGKQAQERRAHLEATDWSWQSAQLGLVLGQKLGQPKLPTILPG